jgi:hypothetical protein
VPSEESAGEGREGQVLPNEPVHGGLERAVHARGVVRRGLWPEPAPNKGLQATGNSLCSCLAPAVSRA